MQRLRPAHAVVAPQQVLLPQVLDQSVPPSATLWDFLHTLRVAGWHIAKKPAKTMPEPYKLDDLDRRIWYLTGATVATLEKARSYMKVLVRAQHLLRGSAVVAVHHCQSSKYYDDLLSGKHNGELACAASRQGGRAVIRNMRPDVDDVAVAMPLPLEVGAAGAMLAAGALADAGPAGDAGDSDEDKIVRLFGFLRHSAHLF